jgi:nitroreductase
MALMEDLQWRYATKRMNGQTVPQEKLDYILEAARLAPTSSGVQPFQIWVITNPELLEKIKPIAYGQSQITECSHLLVWAGWDSYTKERLGEVILDTAKQRGMPEAAAQTYLDRLWGIYQHKSTEWHAQHAARQAYISLTMAMVAAAEQKVDCTPMEGFNNGLLDELLNLGEKGLKSQVILPIGYRDAEKDWLVNHQKVRKPLTELVVTLP